MSKLVFALSVTLLGLAIVFVVLVVLIVFSKLTKYANLIPSREDIKRRMKDRRADKKKDLTLAETAKEQAEAVKAVASAPEPVSLPAPDADELNAVIAAAIAAYLAAEPAAAAIAPNGIVVRSVRRTSGFNTASRYERMNNRI